MPIDDSPATDASPDLPGPDVDDPATDALALDAAFQAGVDSALAAKSWVEAALSVLSAKVRPGEEGTHEWAAIREMRAAAASRITRIMAGDLDRDAK